MSKKIGEVIKEGEINPKELALSKYALTFHFNRL